MVFAVSLLEHWRHFSACVDARQGSGTVDLKSLKATVEVGARRVEFIAQFIVRKSDGSRTYAIELESSAYGFIGWLPYFNKRWPVAIDKVAFKSACQSAGIPIPAGAPELTPALGDFVIKRARGSSIGQGVRGPFKVGASDGAMSDGEFAEQFISGEVGKAWYWNDQLVTLELRSTARVTGDGRATIGELVRSRNRSADVSKPTEFMRYQELDWAYVPRDGEAVAIDYKYGSPYYQLEWRSMDRLAELRNEPIGRQLAKWGPVLWRMVPADIRAGVLFSVDCILQSTGELVLLEMNCNPMVPPTAYEPIFTSLFGLAQTGTAINGTPSTARVGSSAPIALSANNPPGPAATPMPASPIWLVGDTA